jgi:hypothetical protein
MSLQSMLSGNWFGELATAILAIPATEEGKTPLTVAKVATIAVAKPPKQKAEAVQSVISDAETLASLAQFRFDLLQADIDAGYAVAELHRVNNMAWEFMQVDGMAFNDAITLAAELVVKGQVAACEAAYCDVMALFQKVTDAKN